MPDPIIRVEPWPTAEQPTHHLVVFTGPDAWWQHEHPDKPGWVEVRVLEVVWEASYEAMPAADVAAPFMATLGFPLVLRKADGTTVELPTPMADDQPVKVRHVDGMEIVTGTGYDSVRWPAPPPPSAPIEMGFSYSRRDGRSNLDRTFDWTEADVEAGGSVKWDGCVNYSIGLDDGVLAHACEPSDITEVAAALVRAVEIAYEIMGVEHG